VVSADAIMSRPSEELLSHEIAGTDKSTISFCFGRTWRTLTQTPYAYVTSKVKVAIQVGLGGASS